MSNSWTFEEIDTLYKNYAELGVKGCAELLGRSEDDVTKKVISMDIRYGMDFTDYEKKIASVYSDSLGTALCFVLPYRTPSEIESLILCVNS